MTAKYVLECWSSGASPNGRTVTLNAEDYSDAQNRATKLLPALSYGYTWRFRVLSIEELPEEEPKEEVTLSEAVMEQIKAGIASLNAGQGISATRRIRKTGV